MSIVADQVRRLDVQIDRLSLIPLISVDGDEDRPDDFRSIRGRRSSTASLVLSTRRADVLLRIVKELSTTSSGRPLLSSDRIQTLLRQSGLASPSDGDRRHDIADSHEIQEIEWLLVGKATIQVYGIVLNALLEQIVPLGDDIWYWDDVLASYYSSSIYTVQVSPIRLWGWTKDVYRESKHRLEDLRRRRLQALDAGRLGDSLSRQWQQFYSIVRGSVMDRSLSDLQARVLSPVALARAQARHKQHRLKRLREMTASALGVLIDEGLSFGIDDDGKNGNANGIHEWKGVVERSVALMDMVLATVLSPDVGVSEFEDKIFAGVEDDPELSVHVEESETSGRPAILTRRLLNLLRVGLPQHITATRTVVRQNGRPSVWIRYWLPASLLLFSSSAILRVLVKRQDEVINWIISLGTTVKDFWFNWVVEPVGRILRTIRHDTNSEIAIMSRDSLKADRDSLERMVVQFAIDKPQNATGSSAPTEAQIADIRAKVKEGDVTPVLKAYEKDLRRPFMGAIRGDLVRALLIQVQKTKVDLEVAISGIDALLKSQELVFGFVGLTPGVLVSIGVVQYLRTMLGSRSGIRRGQKAVTSVRVLRNIDRILAEATPSQSNVLSYKDHGLLVCEVHVLRSMMHGLLPRNIEKEFLEDLNDLAGVKVIQLQMKALDRIRWAYGRWLK